MRTLTFGDRTISYDAGLDTINTEEATTGNKGLEKKQALHSSCELLIPSCCHKLSKVVISCH